MGINSRAFSANPNDYKLLEEIGYGATATVYRAIHLPSNFVVAVKCLDLDRCNSKLDDIRREAQTMSLIDHPNVVKAYSSFAVEHYLWVVMPFMAEGSCLHLMKVAYQEGLEEAAIASILKETLKALVYLHEQGHIHRDVKAGNILLDSNGEVKLADFGVSACMFDTGDRQRSRNTFTGTPCWMAPEVLQPGSGYDFKADIWSFGISALELAHGHAPFSKYPPMKVLLMTIQNAPPGLDYDRDKKFTKSFKEMVAMCLVKDQTKRPTAEKLLKHSFFKHAKLPQHTVKKLFADLPPLWNRVKTLQLKDAEQLALKKMPSSEEEALSQSEYQRGVSAWNFDIEDLKAQASLVHDDNDVYDFPDMRGEDESGESLIDDKDLSCSNSGLRKLNLANESQQSGFGGQVGNEVPKPICLKKIGKSVESDLLKSDYQEKVVREDLSSNNEVKAPLTKNYAVQPKNKTEALKDRLTQSGPLVPGIIRSLSSLESRRFPESSENGNQPAEKTSQVRRAPNLSGPLMLPRRASGNSLSAPIKSSGGFRESLDDKSKANLVKIKGRFSVTSENVDLAKDIPSSTVPRRTSQGSPLKKSASVGNWILESKNLVPSPSFKESGDNNIPTSILSVHLHNLLQQTSNQQDYIMNLLNSLQPAEAVDATQNGNLPPVPCNSANNGTIEISSSERECMLLTEISELQARMISLSDELTAEKLKQAQLQKQLTEVYVLQENGEREVPKAKNYF